MAFSSPTNPNNKSYLAITGNFTGTENEYFEVNSDKVYSSDLRVKDLRLKYHPEDSFELRVDDLTVKPGEIIIRQRGTNTHPGENVGMGKDHTLFATSAGQVQFTYKGIKQKKTVNVISQ